MKAGEEEGKEKSLEEVFRSQMPLAPDTSCKADSWPGGESLP